MHRSVHLVTEPFIPKAVTFKDKLPEPFSQLRNPMHFEKSKEELQNEALDVSIVITEDQASTLESVTRTQSKSKLWYQYRAGRITASNMKSACATKVDNPSMSFINQVCYPSAQKLNTLPIQWGQKK